MKKEKERKEKKKWEHALRQGLPLKQFPVLPTELHFKVLSIFIWEDS